MLLRIKHKPVLASCPVVIELPTTFFSPASSEVCIFRNVTWQERNNRVVVDMARPLANL